MQFPTALAVTQVNINLLPWECLYWGKETTRICGSTARVQFGLGEDIPKVPSILEWKLSPAQGWSSAGARAELRVQQNKPRVWLGLPTSSLGLGGRAGLGGFGQVGLEPSPRQLVIDKRKWPQVVPG